MTEITINLHDQPCGNCTVCIGRTIGAKHEQERIIKLLEDEKKAYKGIMFSARRMGATTTVYHWEDRIRYLDSYIELIKGENK